MRKPLAMLALLLSTFTLRTHALAGICVEVPFGDSVADLPYTFVLKNVSLRPGATGAISGYAVRSDGLFVPVSGGYMVTPFSALITLTRGFVSFNSVVGGNQAEAALINLDVPIDLPKGNHCSWRKNNDGSIASGCGPTMRVSCKSVPPIPKKRPEETTG